MQGSSKDFAESCAATVMSRKKEKLQLVTQQAAHAGHILCQRFDRFVATISTDSTSDTPPLQRHLLPLDLEDVASQL